MDTPQGDHVQGGSYPTLAGFNKRHLERLGHESNLEDVASDFAVRGNEDRCRRMVVLLMLCVVGVLESDRLGQLANALSGANPKLPTLGVVLVKQILGVFSLRPHGFLAGL